MFRAINITVVLGSHDIGSQSEPYRQTFTVTANKIKSHPQWYYGSVENDIALLELPKDISFTGTTFDSYKCQFLTVNLNGRF